MLLTMVEEKCIDYLKSGIPDHAAIIVDAGPLIRSIKPIPATFGGLADAIFSALTKFAKNTNCARLDFVVDRYPQWQPDHTYLW